MALGVVDGFTPRKGCPTDPPCRKQSNQMTAGCLEAQGSAYARNADEKIASVP